MALQPKLIKPLLWGAHDYAKALGAAALYKYTKKQHVDGILLKGTVCVSTVLYCRRYEERNLIGDSREGLQDYNQHVDYWSSETGGPLPERLSHVLSLDGRNCVIKNCSVDGTIDSGDRFVFCLSLKRSRKLMRKLGYDSCIEIRQPIRFFSALDAEMRRHGRFIGLSRVSYFDSSDVRESQLLQNLHPLQIKRKRKRYANQHEVRIAWQPFATEAIQPILVSSPEIASCCRRIRF